jgi:hypothetical protein
MPFRDSPAFAAWRHRYACAGSEVVFLHPDGAGQRVEGATTAVEDGEAWLVRLLDHARLRLDYAHRANGWSERRPPTRDATLEATELAAGGSTAPQRPHSTGASTWISVTGVDQRVSSPSLGTRNQ